VLPGVPKLVQTSAGGWFARKRLPKDVQGSYASVWGVRHEAFFRVGPMPRTTALVRFQTWLAEIANRIEAIRAEHRGEGRVLSPKDARALSGEWYTWYITVSTTENEPEDWWWHQLEELHDYCRQAIATSRGHPWHQDIDPADVWQSPASADRVLAFVSDTAKTAQFLHSKQLALDGASKRAFLQWIAKVDLEMAYAALARQAAGDYADDNHPKSFPRFQQGSDLTLTAWALFERWTIETKPAVSTVDRWRAVFIKLKADFPDYAASRFTREELRVWIKSLVSDERSARTVNDVWVTAARTVFAWAVNEQLITFNPFLGLRVPSDRRGSNRQHKFFTADEVNIILSASLAIKEPMSNKTSAARRWVPWILAYSGARSGEICQLRASDVYQDEGIWVFKIPHEAGTTKTGDVRVVPLHTHLLSQGFLDFVKASGAGQPLFYNTTPTQPSRTKRIEGDATNPPKPRYVKAREHLAAWVRKLGVTDADVGPNHAWRHLFKQRGAAAKIEERLLDAICGHAPASVGRGDGAPTTQDKAEAISRFPHYTINPTQE
jgi:integrase